MRTSPAGVSNPKCWKSEYRSSKLIPIIDDTTVSVVGGADPDLDVCALHFVYLPIIQCQVDMFREAWCNHPLHVTHNRTPHQLWILGMTQARIETPTSRAVLGVTGITEVCIFCNQCYVIQYVSSNLQSIILTINYDISKKKYMCPWYNQ